MSEFKIGGKVIATANADRGDWVKGEIKTVRAMIVCACGRLKLDLGYTTNQYGIGKCKCSNCDNILSDNWVLWCGCKKWQPLDDMQTELSETTVEELLQEGVEV